MPASWSGAAGPSPPASASASGARPPFGSPHRRWPRTMRDGLPRTSLRLFAHEERRLREPRLDGSIQELDQRRDGLEHLEQLRIEPGTGGERGLGTHQIRETA